MCHYFFRAPFQPELSPSCIISDLTDLLEEACLPGSVSDVAIQVIRLTLCNHMINTCTYMYIITYYAFVVW